LVWAFTNAIVSMNASRNAIFFIVVVFKVY
jgi:hypothetical protein